MTRTYLLTLLLLLQTLTSSAYVYRFLHLNSSQGLPSTEVEALAEGKDGYIWMGTRNGLCRYDGYTVEVYYHDDNNPHSIGHNYIHNLFVDHQGNVWIGQENGISRYRPASDDFVNYPNSRHYARTMVEDHRGHIFAGENGLFRYDHKTDSFMAMPTLNYGRIRSLAVDRYDNLYVATSSSIYRYDRTLTRISNVMGIKAGSDFIRNMNEVIMPLMVDSKNRLWIGRNGEGVMWIDLKSRQQKIYGPETISNGIVRSIEEDAYHNVWLGTEGGITVVQTDGSIRQLRHEIGNPYSISDNAIYTILSDCNSNIWIGSYFGGVDILPNTGTDFLWLQPGLGAGNLTSRVVRGMIETEPGIFWLALENGGINIYNSHTGIVTPLNNIRGMGTNVHSLMRDRLTGDIWIGTRFSGLFRYNPKTGLQHRYYLEKGLDTEGIFDIKQQHNGKIWLATMRGLRCYNPITDNFTAPQNPVLRNHFIYTLLVDRKDNIWAGTIDAGVCVIDAKTGKVTQISKGKRGMRDNYIISLFQDHSGTIWIGTNNYGLFRIDNPKGMCKAVGEKSLSTKTICAINEDVKGNLWISTNQGLYRLNRNRNRLEEFSEANGLPVSQFNYNSSLRASDGRILMGTMNGLISFDPEAMQIRFPRCDIHLKKLVINNQPVSTISENSPLTTALDSTTIINLSYEQSRSFYVDFGVIIPCQNNGVEYQFMVKGLDDQWRNMGSEHRFYGSNLQPGNYTLMMRARYVGQSWNQSPVRKLQIKIRPPFYRSTLAYLFYIALLAVIIYYVMKLMRARQEQRNQVRIAQIEKEKIEEMDHEKSNFFSSVSHELKTPLSLIMAPLKTVSMEKHSKETTQHLNMALKNAFKMQRLIDQLVTFNKLGSHSFPLYLHRGNPMEFIMQQRPVYALTAHEKHISLNFQCEDNGEQVWFSNSYLDHILSNLLSNAFKFTPEGGHVEVEASIANRADDNYDYLRLTVSDNGIGIKEEEQTKIFDEYYQTKRGYNADSNGWGIGLSLVKKLVEQQKGFIELDSKPGAGSHFTVWLNVSASAFPKQSITEGEQLHKSSDLPDLIGEMPALSPEQQQIVESMDERQRPKILVVEDNNDLLQFLTSFFAADYNVLAAHNGGEALDLLNKEDDVQLVISDVMMPKMDGYELCRRLKSDMRTSHIPIILLTAKTGNDDRLQGFKSGAEAYIPKPFDPQMLQLQVKNMLQLVHKRQEVASENKTDEENDMQFSEIDLKFINQINELVDKNLDNSDFSVTDITRQLSISRSLLYTKMKALMGVSIGDFIHQRRMKKACSLLRQGYNVSETAYQSGFSDPNYFAKVFKKDMGMTPTEYIKKER
ncbi:MAG: hybrid sensor histidine kinase/response regulator transcription factor [Prevotella sp.]|jgi:ligand-binding sensor domain-containing protein/signal transduction histidine kinase/DNA-binding response OmpR family regulator